VGNLGLVLVCLVVGFFARRTGRFPKATPDVLGRIVIDVALPALTVITIHELRIAPGAAHELALLLATPFVVFALSVALLAVARRVFALSRETVACLLLTAGLANTSFVGFPLVEALFGREGLARAVVVDQGQFLVLATFGIASASLGKGEARPSARALAGRLVVFPPFLAFVAALALRPVALPAALVLVLEKLAALVVPLALIAVGFQLELDRRVLATERRNLILGLGLRLVVAPAVIAALLHFAYGPLSLAAEVAIAESAMAPMVTGAVLAMESKLEPRLATAMVAIGVPLSLVSVPLWASLSARL